MKENKCYNRGTWEEISLQTCRTFIYSMDIDLDINYGLWKWVIAYGLGVR